MRKIEFRGLRTDGKGWVYGVPYFLNIKEDEPEDCVNKCCMIKYVDWDGTCGFLSPDNNALVEIIPETVGQFIGLTDKNGKKIFEGDKFPSDEPEEYYLVNWNEKEGRFQVDLYGYNIYYGEGGQEIEGNEICVIDTDCFDVSALQEDQIIGNIHENK